MASWDINLVQTTLKAWADLQSGITFVMAGQPGPPPALPYGTIQILSGPVSSFADGQESVYNSGPDNVTFRARNIGVSTIRFQAFSQSQSGTTSARAYLEELAGTLTLPTSQGTLAAAGLAPHSAPGVSDLSETLGNEVRGRASVDIVFNIGTQATETISYIDNIEGTGTVDLPDGSTVNIDL